MSGMGDGGELGAAELGVMGLSGAIGAAAAVLPASSYYDEVWTYLAHPLEPGDTQVVATRAFADTEVLGFPIPSPGHPIELIIGREVLQATDGTGTEGDPWIVTRARRGTTAPPMHVKRAKITLVGKTITATHGLSVWDYTARWGAPRQFRVTAGLPGGPDTATWTVQDYPPYTALPDPRSAVVISDAAGAYWIGLIDEDDPQYTVQGASVTLVAKGYAIRASDASYTQSRIFPAFTPVYQIIKFIGQDLIPEIIPGVMIGGGRSIIAQTGDFIGKKAQDGFNEAASHGDSPGDTPVFWRIQGTPSAPAVPRIDVINRAQLIGTRQYYVPLEWLTPPTIKWITSLVTNQAVIQYGRGVVAESNNPGIAALGGMVRSRFINAAGQIDGIGNAQMIGKSIVATYGTLMPTPGGIQIQYPHYLLDGMGNIIPLWRAQPGAALFITGITTGNTRLQYLYTFVKGVAWDGESRVESLSTEQAMMMVDDIGAYLRDVSRAPNSPLKAPTPVSAKASSTPQQRAGLLPSDPGFRTPGTHADTPPADINGRSGYPILPPGIDITVPLFTLGNGINEDSLAAGVSSLIQTHYPVRFLGVSLMLNTAASVVVRLYRLDIIANVATETLLGEISSAGFQYSTAFTLAPPFAGAPLNSISFEAGTWFVGRCLSTDGFASQATLSLYGHKLEGRTELFDTSPPSAAAQVQVTTSANGATFVIKTSEFTTVSIEYGNSVDLNGNWPPDFRYALIHTVVVEDNFLPGQMYYFKVHATDMSGNNAVIAAGTFTA